MYEGKNIHYSSDQKRLCSFSGKICNQRRLNNYGFCVRHILEDASAPFKRCAYVAKSSRQTCTQAIPQSEEREYCNNHMQVLGMLPKKERKPKKEKDRLALLSAQIHSRGAKSDPGLLQNKIRPRPSVGSIKSKLISNKLSSRVEESDDIYAFPTDSYERNKTVTTGVPAVTSTDLSTAVTGAITYSVRTSSAESGQSSLAKIYPELAEKLEKIKPKVEVKVKGKVKSSRTMNSLQTKIAQNKIKDKLKKNHCSSNASSQSQSPSHSFSSSPGYQLNATSPAHSVHSPNSSIPPNVTIGRDGKSVFGAVSAGLVNSSSATSEASAASLSPMTILNGLNLQTLNLSLEQLGLPVPTVSDIEQTLKQLASAANISLDGGPVHRSEPERHTIPHGLPVSNGVPSTSELHHLLPQTYIPQTKPPPPYSSVHHKPVNVTLSNVGVTFGSGTMLSHADNTISQPLNIGHQILPVSKVTSQDLANSPAVSRAAVPSAPTSGVKVVPTSSALSLSLSSTFTALTSPVVPSSVVSTSVASSPAASSSLSSACLSVQPKLTLLTTAQASSEVSSKVTDSDKQKLTMASFQQPKTKPVKSRPRSRNPSSGIKRPAPQFPLPLTVVKPRKIRKLLEDDEINKLKTKSAIELYRKNKKKKTDNHNMIYSSIASSDESDLSDCDMLPWQHDWFRASSDEEAVDEEESDHCLRTAKLAVGRARLRRQCSQARLSTRSPQSKRSLVESTSDLIQTAKESPKYTVRCLKEIYHIKSKPPERLKSKGLMKRQCLYRDNNEVQCKNNVVPYTNHCIKHVMYNVDQQLFEYCTAKFADNTQCCHPVIDVKHELPLCIEHGMKADNFLKIQDLDHKPKKQRKKTKPSALTRPPKKGKKKKNQRKSNVTEKQTVLADSEENDAMESENEEESTRPYSGKGEEKVSVKCESQPFSHLSNMEKPSKGTVNVTAVDAKSCKPSLVVSDGIKVSTAVSQNKVQVDKVIVKSDSDLGKLADRKLELSDQKLEYKEIKQRPEPLGVFKSEPVTVKEGKKKASLSQFEDLENFGSVLENVKMFGDLETTASKLLEEHDFQEVFSKLPDVTFDIFNSKGLDKLPVTDELPDIEDSLALANREMKLGKEGQGLVSSGNSRVDDMSNHGNQSHVPILDEADDLTRQIAEEILKQNIGPSASMEGSMCNGDAEESIKAIARSLSNSSMMLAAEAKKKSDPQETLTVGQNMLRTQSLPAYNSLDSQFFPPNVAVQNIPVTMSQSVTGLVPAAVLAKHQGNTTQSQAYIGPVQTRLIPQNVTVTPQGIITAHSATARLAPVSQTVTIGNTTVTGNQSAGIITLPVAQQLTAQQLSALVQQATAHLPPLPPYTPRSQTPVTTSQVAPITTPKPVTQNVSLQQSAPGISLQQSATRASISQASLTSESALSQSFVIQQPVQAATMATATSVPGSRPLTSQDMLIQQLAKQQEHLGEQQQLLAQQILQQRIALLTQQALPVNVTLTGSQNIALPIRFNLQSQNLPSISGGLNLTPVTSLTQHSVPVCVTLTSIPSVSTPGSVAITSTTGATQPDVPVRAMLSTTQGVSQQNASMKVTLPAGPSIGPQGVTLPSSQNLGFSTILHQGQLGQLGRLNQGAVHTLPNAKHVSQLIKTNRATSQTPSAPVNAPATSIVWTSPPNVTITSPNGLPRNITQTFMTGSKVVTSKDKTSAVKETFIDLTEDPPPPPPYEAVSTHARSAPASPSVILPPTSSGTAVAGKS